LSLFAIIAIVAVLFTPLQFAVPATIAVVLLTSGLINLLRPSTIAYQIFTQPQVVYVGLISYSLYLWHWGVLSISRWTVGIHWWTVPFQIGLMFLLAIISYRYIEKPFRKSSHSPADRCRSGLMSGLVSQPIKYSMTASISTALALVLLANGLGDTLYLGTLLRIPTRASLRVPWYPGDICHTSVYTPSKLAECLQTAEESTQPILYLIGDSNSRNYLDAAQTAFPNYQSRHLTMGSFCSIMPDSLIRDLERDREPYLGGTHIVEASHCLEYAQDVTAFLSSNIKKGDIVFIGQALAFDMRRRTPEYTGFIGSIASSLAKKGASVIWSDGIVSPTVITEYCYPLPWQPFEKAPAGCFHSRAEVMSRYAVFDRLAQAEAKRHLNLFYVPLREGLCVGEVCGPINAHGTFIWYDQGHITEQASAELSPLLLRQLKAQGFHSSFK
jgi:hypothetical protein